MEELEREIKTFKEAGDEICLCLDLNENIRGNNAFNTAMQRVHMKEAIVMAHGADGPPTRRGSRHPIDGIYLTSNLSADASGYGAYVEGVGDHRPLWIDIPTSLVFGEEPGRLDSQRHDV